MEENKITGEQPSNTEVQTVATDVDNGTQKYDGSPLGKFKTPDTLLDAYNELQSEFTRKCQKLSETEKKLQELDIGKASTIDSEEEFVWKKNIGEFLRSHKNASELMDDITNEIINDESLKNSEDGLQKAYSRVIEKKFVPYGELVEDIEFLDKYIYSNEKIKEKIIKEYVSTLQNSRSPIAMGSAGFSVGAGGGNNFKSLEDARAYVESMFR